MSSKKHVTKRSPVRSNRRKEVAGSARQHKPVSANRQELATGETYVHCGSLFRLVLDP